MVNYEPSFLTEMSNDHSDMRAPFLNKNDWNSR
jgi:hypothetical protein